MDPTQLQELARAIAYHTVLDTWPYWVTLVTLVVLGVVGGNYLASYAAKRGEVQAAKADRKEILEGIRKTTEATEEVRSAVALDEWTERERRALKRAKLEELVILAFKTRDWLCIERDRNIWDKEKPEEASPQATMMTIGSLYFPELTAQLVAYNKACHSYYQKILDVCADIAAARSKNVHDEHAAYQAVSDIRGKAQSEQLDLLRRLTQSLSGLATAAAELMKTIIAPPK